MPSYRDKGYVLKTKAVRETDRHYTVFTRDHGKVVVLAKGMRKHRSTMAPHMASFGLVDILVARGRVIDRLAGASLERPHRDIMDSLERTALLQAFHVAVDALTKRELPDERIFDLIGEFQRTLAVQALPSAVGRSLLFDAVIARLLDHLGFGLELAQCVGCRAALVPHGNALNLMHGGAECAACRDAMAMAVSGDAIKALRFLRNAPLTDVLQLRMPPRIAQDVAFITDLQLTHHLESRFPALQYLRQMSAA